MARAHACQLATATSPTVLLLPKGGCGEWDRPGAELHDPAGLAAFCDEMIASCPGNTDLHQLDCHINDPAFADFALQILDGWIDNGTVVNPLG